MSNAQDIESELLVFLSREVFGPEVALTPETDLVGNGFDSVSLVRLLLFVETRYGLWIPEGEITPEALHDARSLAITVARLLDET